MTTPMALNLIGRATGLLLVALLAALALRRAPAAARHRVWACATLALLLLPAVTVLAPRWGFGIPVAAPEPVSVPYDSTEAVTPAALADPGPIAQPFPWPALLTAIWAIGALASLAPVALGGWKVVRLPRAPLTEPIADLLETAVRRVGVRRPAAALAPVPVPLTYGWPRASLLLPADAPTWPTDRLEAALLHELAHIRRRDWAWQMASEMARALWWFHPLVYVAGARLRAEAEAASDRRVVDTGIAAPDYAQHLLDIALTLRKGTAP